MPANIEKLIEFIKNYSKARNYKVFLVFVMISTIFWLLIKFSKQYTSIVQFPVEYTSIPNDLVWDAIPENSLYMSTTASGFQHLSYALWKQKVRLDMSKIRNLSGYQYYLIPKEQISEIIDQFPSNIELVYRSPDSIFFDLSKRIEKKVAVVLRDSLSLAPSFRFVKHAVVKPDSVVVSGPESVVSTINSIETELLVIDNIRKNTTESVKLKPLGHKKVEVANKYVEVSLEVEQFTQNTIEVPIIIKNVPSGYLLKIFPDNVKVTFNTSLSNFEEIDQSSFYVIADYNKIKEANSQLIPLKLKLQTSKAELVKFEPEEVEFLLREIN